MRIVLKLLGAPVDRSVTIRAPQKGAGQPTLDLLRDLEERHVSSGTGGTLDFELVAEKSTKVQLSIIADARKSIFSPPICPRTRLVVREIVPSISIAAVVFTDRTPLSFA